ncbi:MAG TPA: class I SAM-dependent methyltransferase [Kineosporiaceae bacterium]
MHETLLLERFPRASTYHPDWVTAAVSGGANPLWLTEWLSEAMHLVPGMRVLDLGCGRAASSVFLRREFGVQVWAADLWFSPTENLRRARDADVADGVFPLRADARALPFANEFFDAVVSIDSFVYYGTDDLYLADVARFVRPGGQIGIAGAGLVAEIEDSVPAQLATWWEPSLWCLHSAGWWRRHWERTGIVHVQDAATMPDGWRHWLAWQQLVSPDNATEIAAVEADQGRTLGYIRVVGRRREDIEIHEPVTRIETEYVARPMLRTTVAEPR